LAGIAFCSYVYQKVYSDAPNHLNMLEMETSWEYGGAPWTDGIPENFTIDQSKHALFGGSKVAGDVMVREYGFYFVMLTCCLRGGGL
jgi:CDP-paratose 2-epimerase